MVPKLTHYKGLMDDESHCGVHSCLLMHTNVAGIEIANLVQINAEIVIGIILVRGFCPSKMSL